MAHQTAGRSPPQETAELFAVKNGNQIDRLRLIAHNFDRTSSCVVTDGYMDALFTPTLETRSIDNGC